MIGTSIEDANFSPAQSAGLRSREVKGSPAFLSQALKLHGGFLIGPGVSLRGVDLSFIDLNGFSLANADLTDAVFVSSHLANVDLDGANLSELIFKAQHLETCK